MKNIEQIKIIKQDSLAWVYFNNEAKANAINYQMWKRMPSLIEELNNEQQVRVIILRGAGNRYFTAGADLSEFKTLRANTNTSKLYDQATEEAFRAIKNSYKPVVAMINGPCIGGGLAIALQCDIRISSQDAKFGIPAAKRGIAYGYQGVKDVVDAVGPALAKEMLFTGRHYSADIALKNGLIHQLAPKDNLEEFTLNYCQELAANAPLSIGSAKIAILEMLKDPEARDLEKVEREMAKCYNSADYQEGYTAFLEKRKPNFLGR